MKNKFKKYVFALFLLIVLISIILTSAFNFNSNIFTKTGQLKVTPEHPFLVGGKWLVASELKIGDELTNIYGKKIRIKSIKKVHVPEGVNVYNLEAGIYNDFILKDGIVVHNSNAVKSDCVLGSCKVDVIYPDGSIEKMSFSKFYQKYQNNPSLKIIGEDGNALSIKSVVKNVNLEGETQIVRFNIGEDSLRLTSSHEIQLIDGSFVKASDLRNGMLLRTNKNPVAVKELTTYKASGVKAYDIVTSKPYSLVENGPILRSVSSDSSGILPGASNWDSNRVYARIVSDAEYKEIMRTSSLRPAEEGQLIPTIDAQSKKAIERLSTMSPNELKDYYQQILGGKGPNKKIVFFRSSTPPEVDGGFVRGVSDIQEAKFTGGPIEIIRY